MISAEEIAETLKIDRPTSEQIDVIQNAPIDAPAAVIAGAGSGKTELMSARVLWLVANKVMAPTDVLGLTFTRKAAKELQTRVTNRLNQLRETELWPTELPQDFDLPKIATYNSFANEVFRSVSLVIGYESDVPLLGEAGTFLLARKFVESKAYALVPNIAESDRRADSLVDLIIALESELGEHRISAKEVDSFIMKFVGFVRGLPKNSGGTDTIQFSYTTDILAPLLETTDIAKLAEGFRDFKRLSATVDYSDQLRLAADAIEAQPELAETYRGRYRQVLLDEYQDTSSVQVRLLSSLFHSRAVLAVGDPNQSIYGWRGAAAGTMESFGKRFGAASTNVFPLTTNWRSDRKILEVANSVALSLTSASNGSSTGAMVLKPGPDRADGEVLVRVFEHELDEAAEVAMLLREKLSNETSVAILFRKRKHMARFAAALDAKNVPYEISGLGGLLQVPEVADLVAALRVVADPESGVALMRLLAGPRWRIGPADLSTLNSYSKKLGRARSESGTNLPVTIVEALDELAQPKPFMLPDFSDSTLARLTEAARLFRVLRKQVNLSLTEFARAVTAELWLDIELMASGRYEPLSNLYSFYDLIGEFESTANEPDLYGFLNWLDHAERRQRLEPPKNGVKRGVVQLLTIHSSKGLEWDVVAIPDLVEGEFPSEERSYRGWLAAGKLPYPLRSDSASLPDFEWAKSDSQKDLKERFNTYRALVKEHLYSEQGRLAYVAFTRAKHSLVLSGSHWATGGESPRSLSRYLDLVFPVVDPAKNTDQESSFVENPYPAAAENLTWPSNLGSEVSSTRTQLGEIVLSNLATPALLDVATAADELVRKRSISDLKFPTRLSATALSSFILKPQEFLDRLARPLPSEYFSATELGTQFHTAVEEWFEAGEGSENSTLKEFAEQREEAADLAQRFINSEFSAMAPLHIELPIQFVLGNLVVICKLDAVFETASGLEVVDWKTGSAQDQQKMRLQLSLYRLAIQRFTGLPLEQISAALFFAKDGQTVRLENLFEESELLTLIEEARKVLRDPSTPANP